MTRFTARCASARAEQVFALLGCLGVAALAPPADAQAPGAAQAKPAAFTFSIPKQPLSQALLRFSEQCGFQLFFDAPMAQGLSSNDLSGRYAPDEALKVMLEGTGLKFRFVRPGVFTLEKLADSSTRVLGPVQVEGAASSSAASGINGSSDVTATEGTHSYTTGALTIGSKTARSIRETPQSVSVVTQQRIQDQNITDVTGALAQSTGITLTQSDSSRSRFYSRGFQITNFQLDGGTPMVFNNFGNWSLPDIAQYDHIEVLRGPDGMFSGAGEAGGVVNLSRKRPLDHAQVNLDVNAGSWKNRRIEVDLAGPLAYDGALRGRLVGVYEDKDFFYDLANTNKTMFYAIAEADLGPSTLLSAGGSIERKNNHGMSITGLPRYENGGDLGLPRRTNLATDWSRWDFDSPEIFVQLEQAIGARWSAKLNVTRSRQTSYEKHFYIYGAVDPATGIASDVGAGAGSYTSNEVLSDLTVNGKFTLFGREHEFIAGASRQLVESTVDVISSDTVNFEHANVFTYDPKQYAEFGVVSSYDLPELGQAQQGAHASLRLNPVEGLRLIAGMRWSKYSYDQLMRFPYVDANGNPAYSFSPLRYEDSGVITPYYGVVYDLNRNWSVYTSYTDIFLSQANYHVGPRPGGASLDPVVGGSLEAGVKTSWMDGLLNASIAAYHIRRSNEAVADENYPYDPFDPGLQDGNACCYLSNGEARSEGVDAEVTGEILPGWQISAGYTFNQNSYRTGDGSERAYHSQTPKHLLKLWTNARLPGALSKWSIGGGVTAQTANYKSGTVCVEKGSFEYEGQTYSYCARSVPFDFTVGAWAIANARAEYRIDRNWTAALNLNNITDRTYYQTVGDPTMSNWYGEPRSYMLSVRGTF